MSKQHFIYYHISESLRNALNHRREVSGKSVQEIIEEALHQYLEVDEDTLFQTSPITMLVEGIYQGETTIEELKKHGDFGLGTFNDLDGEMLALDGKFYQLTSDGKARIVPNEVLTPFASVTFWNAKKTVELNQALNYHQLQEYLTQLLPSKNLFYAIKIEGEFASVKTRTVARQDKPTRLVEAAANQAVYEFTSVKGTMVGYWTPTYMNTLNVPGYHLHFITENRASGGHLLDCVTNKVLISLDETPQMKMALPLVKSFLQADLSKDISQELEKAEK